MKLKTKFFLIFVLISIIPVLLVAIIVYDRYTIMTQESMLEVYENIFHSATDMANQSIAEIKHTLEASSFYTDAEHSIINDLEKYTEGGSFTPGDVFESNNNLKFLCQNLIYSTDNLNAIFIFTPSGQVLGYGKITDVMPNYTPFEDSWYKKTVALKGKTYVDGISEKDFLIRSEPSISFSKALYDVYSHEFLGVLFVDYAPEIFDLSKVNTLPQTVLLSVETDEDFILYTNVDTLSDPLPSSKSGIQVYKSSLDMDGLYLISSVNPQRLFEEFQITQRMILILAGIYIILLFVISFFLSKYLTKPIAHLSEQMSNHKLHNYVTDERYLNRMDEIGTLYNEYNSMLEEQEKHIKNEYQNKLITLDSQMKSLEAQINSHFLYNTLESINSLAELEGIESISVMSMALGNMFRYSIKAKSELVSVAEEISNVQDYVSIQRIRFQNKFRLELDIPDNLYRCKVLKLILQPIVENALIHGLNRCTEGDVITIRAYTQEQNFFFEVKDNGVGMDNHQLNTIRSILAEPPQFKELGHRSTQSIGLKNINSRIELYYGAGYGMMVNSTPGTGTIITLKLPYFKQED